MVYFFSCVQKLKAKIESDTSHGSLESFDDGVSDPNSNEDNVNTDLLTNVSG